MGEISDIQQLVDHLQLQPHPEGGFYRETYRSEGVFAGDHLGGGFDGDRNFSTSIYFLLTSENFSAFHRIRQDEVWHFYGGSPLHIHVIDKAGAYYRHTLGMNLGDGETPQFVVGAGCWFGSSVAKPDAYSLVGCTVSPGFDFRDFELADRAALTESFPKHAAIIRQLTRG